MNIDIPQQDFGTLCICALRYCQGRKTYMPSLIPEIVAEYLGDLSDRDIQVMLGDCDFQRSMNLYGYETDKQKWLKWEHKVREEQKEREQNDE